MINKPKSIYRLFTGVLLLALVCISLVNVCTWLWKWCVNITPIKQPVVVVGVLIVGVLTIVWQAWRTIRCTRKLLGYAQISLPPDLEALISEFGLNPSRLVLLNVTQPLTFCFGFLRPRICLSTGLIEILTQSQLHAALFHEEYHRKRFDPLRLLLVEAVATALFFLPVVREWRASFKIQLELDADQYAILKTGKTALAGALHRLLSDAAVAVPIAQGVIAGLSANSARIAVLLGERTAYTEISRKSLFYSAVILWIICLLS